MLALLLLAAASPSKPTPEALQAVLARISEEAEVFRVAAPQILAEEELLQTAGETRSSAGDPVLRTRRIVSEYSLGTLRDAPGILHEFRRVISVDGRPIRSPSKARRSLTLGLSSEDDRARKRMLEDFQQYGLEGAAVDLGPLILLFGARQLADFTFRLEGQESVDGQPADRLSYRQTGGSQSFLVIEGRSARREPLAGTILVRRPDGFPLQITLTAERSEGGHLFREEAAVDYVQNPHGFAAPSRIVHRGYMDGRLRVEDRFQYTAFRKFGADAEIRFKEIPESRPAGP